MSDPAAGASRDAASPPEPARPPPADDVTIARLRRFLQEVGEGLGGGIRIAGWNTDTIMSQLRQAAIISLEDLWGKDLPQLASKLEFAVATGIDSFIHRAGDAEMECVLPSEYEAARPPIDHAERPDVTAASSPSSLPSQHALSDKEEDDCYSEAKRAVHVQPAGSLATMTHAASSWTIQCGEDSDGYEDAEHDEGLTLAPADERDNERPERNQAAQAAGEAQEDGRRLVEQRRLLLLFFELSLGLTADQLDTLVGALSVELIYSLEVLWTVPLQYLTPIIRTGPACAFNAFRTEAGDCACVPSEYRAMQQRPACPHEAVYGVCGQPSDAVHMEQFRHHANDQPGAAVEGRPADGRSSFAQAGAAPLVQPQQPEQPAEAAAAAAAVSPPAESAAAPREAASPQDMPQVAAALSLEPVPAVEEQQPAAEAADALVASSTFAAAPSSSAMLPSASEADVDASSQLPSAPHADVSDGAVDVQSKASQQAESQPQPQPQPQPSSASAAHSSAHHAAPCSSSSASSSAARPCASDPRSTSSRQVPPRGSGRAATSAGQPARGRLSSAAAAASPATPQSDTHGQCNQGAARVTYASRSHLDHSSHCLLTCANGQHCPSQFVPTHWRRYSHPCRKGHSCPDKLTVPHNKFFTH